MRLKNVRTVEIQLTKFNLRQFNEIRLKRMAKRTKYSQRILKQKTQLRNPETGETQFFKIRAGITFNYRNL